MSLQDRDYYRYQRREQSSRGGFLTYLTPVVKWLLFLNVGVFVIQYVCEKILQLPFFVTRISRQGAQLFVEYSEYEKIFALYVPYLKKYFLFSQYVTYQFMHGGFLHLLFNMLALYMFGRYIEYQIGSRPFIKLYLLGGIFAGICHLVFVNAYGTPVVGASGAICTVLAAFAIMNPDTKLMVFLGFIPVIMKARTMVLLYALYTLIMALISDGNVAHLAHLGGLLFGFMYVKNFLGLKKLIGYAPGDIPRDNSFGHFRERARVYRGPEPHEAGPAQTSSNETTGDERLDEILEKMKKYGMHTLTDEDWQYIQKKRSER
ncbi:rhomboid family intramembrane serine protease [bacterium]|nr:rhomboid family intramembrane serine protease [bacterium]